MRHIFQWDFILVSQSPLRIGNDQDELLLDEQGKPVLPGTSWAGACRAYMESLGYADDLFGHSCNKNTRNPSKLTFSDGICVQTQPGQTRPRVKVDGSTKTIENFFDATMISSGVEFKVKLILKTNDKKDEELIEMMLGALHSGQIRLGAYKSIGGGQFSIKEGTFVHYDCNKQEDLMAYINLSKEKSALQPNNQVRLSSMLTIDIQGNIQSPLLIGGQNAYDSNKADKSSIQVLHHGESYFVIPGSSLKGVLRHQVESIANKLCLTKNNYVEHIFNNKLFLEDIRLQNPRTKTYYRVAIHPITGGTVDGALLNEETLIGDLKTRIFFRFQENSEADAVSLALILFAIREIAEQRQNIGSGGSIGRGDITINKIDVSFGEQNINIDFQKKQVNDRSSWMSKLQKILNAQN